mgnify:CR=1 FL=1
MSIVRKTASFVYTLDKEPIRNGYVEYDDVDGKIISVGECAPGEDVHPGAIVPGFVNAHCHIELSHLYKKFRKGTGSVIATPLLAMSNLIKLIVFKSFWFIVLFFCCFLFPVPPFGRTKTESCNS